MAIADLRREYRLAQLDRSDLLDDPLAQFHRWFAEAGHARGGRLRRFGVSLYKAFYELFTGSSFEVNAMVLATADANARPSARTVLLKGADARGFVFFTNYESRKGRELATNPHAALVFYWPDVERQVCVAGTVTKLPAEESAAYFQSRPRGSRIGAWASAQSEALPNRAALEAKWRETEARFPGDSIPLPPFWGGYVLAPSRIEFWQGRPSRLHDRFCYARQADGTWKLERLSP